MKKKGAKKILKYTDLIREIQHMWSVKNKCNTSKNRDKWNHLKIIQKIPELHNGKA
jgi:hypothetical protein